MWLCWAGFAALSVADCFPTQETSEGHPFLQATGVIRRLIDAGGEGGSDRRVPDRDFSSGPARVT